MSKNGHKTPGIQVGEAFNPHRIFHGCFIPVGVLRYPGLAPGAKLTLGVLFSRAGQNGHCWPSQATLADDLGTSVRQISRHIQELTRERFIRALTRMRERGGQASNLYEFLWHEAYTGTHAVTRESAPSGTTDMSYRGTTDLSGEGVTDPSYRELKNSESSSAVDKYIYSPPTPPQNGNGHKKFADDDPDPDPERRLQRLYRHLTHRRPTAELMRSVRECLELRAVPMADYVREITPHFEAGRLTNPAGFMIAFATRYRQLTAPEPEPATPTSSSEHGLAVCEVCGCTRGKGLILTSAGTIEPCPACQQHPNTAETQQGKTA